MSEGIWASIVQDYPVYITGAAAGVSGLVVIYKKVLKPMFNTVKSFWQTIDKIDTIFEEITPNGGRSVKDRVNKTYHELTFVSERLRAFLADTKDAHFETDAEGNCTRVNRTYTRLVERETSEIIGNGWHNCVLQEDRESVVRAWDDAVDDARELTINFRFETPSGKIIPVRGTSYKMTNDQGEVIGFLGKIQVLENS